MIDQLDDLQSLGVADVALEDGVDGSLLLDGVNLSLLNHKERDRRDRREERWGNGGEKDVIIIIITIFINNGGSVNITIIIIIISSVSALAHLQGLHFFLFLLGLHVQ